MEGGEPREWKPETGAPLFTLDDYKRDLVGLPMKDSRNKPVENSYHNGGLIGSAESLILKYILPNNRRTSESSRLTRLASKIQQDFLGA